jgi:deoxyribose-phosphate aldolase
MKTELAKKFLSLLDLTDLSDTCREDHVEALIRKAITSNVPAICIWPQFVSLAAHLLQDSHIRVATVINFPKGGDNVERAIDDAEEALKDGADEIDLVMPYIAFLAGDEPITRSMIAEVKDLMPDDAILKVIVESGAFTNQAQLATACHLAIEEGADFLKTSTGKSAISATPEAARTMLHVIKETGGTCGFKTSGGIKTIDDAKIYLDIATQIMGDSWITPEHFRVGASTLHEVLLAEIGVTQKQADNDGIF